jgi:hypothetical protein
MSRNPAWPDLESAIDGLSYRIFAVWAKGVGILGLLQEMAQRSGFAGVMGKWARAGGVGMGCALGIRARSKDSRVGQLVGWRSLNPLMEVRILPREIFFRVHGKIKGMIDKLD